MNYGGREREILCIANDYLFERRKFSEVVRYGIVLMLVTVCMYVSYKPLSCSNFECSDRITNVSMAPHRSIHGLDLILTPNIND